MPQLCSDYGRGGASLRVGWASAIYGFSVFVMDCATRAYMMCICWHRVRSNDSPFQNTGWLKYGDFPLKCKRKALRVMYHVDRQSRGHGPPQYIPSTTSSYLTQEVV
ncbi:hypothetical protein VTH06DRAFT_5195 [Thermothelomyces fergusii]